MKTKWKLQINPFENLKILIIKQNINNTEAKYARGLFAWYKNSRYKFIQKCVERQKIIIVYPSWSVVLPSSVNI